MFLLSTFLCCCTNNVLIVNGPSTEELKRGWVIVAGGKQIPKQRLSSLQVDLGLDEHDAIPIEIMGISEKALIRLELIGDVSGVSVRVEEDGWLNTANIMQVRESSIKRFWLIVDSTGREPGGFSFKVRLFEEQGSAFEINVNVTVWNVSPPVENNFGLMMYAYISRLSPGIIDEEAKRRFLTYIKNLQRLRVTNCDWDLGPAQTAKHLKVCGEDEYLYEWSARQKQPIRVKDLPDLDFSYYDFLFDESLKHGMSRFNVIVSSDSGGLRKTALGRELEPNSEEDWELIVWYYAQLRQYALQRGFLEFWAKMGDEIPPKHIPVWNMDANRFQKIGYRTFTTNTRGIPRDSELLQKMNPYSDGWQVHLFYTRDFRQLTMKRPDPEVKLDEEDEVWFYGGGGGFRVPYEETRAYGWRMCALNLSGYGYWTYLREDGQNMLVRLDPATYELTLSAAWHGLRDGNEDAAYFLELKRQMEAIEDYQGLKLLKNIFGYEENALMRLGEVRKKHYAWDDLIGADSYEVFNRAKSVVLRLLQERSEY